MTLIQLRREFYDLYQRQRDGTVTASDSTESLSVDEAVRGLVSSLQADLFDARSTDEANLRRILGALERISLDMVAFAESQRQRLEQGGGASSLLAGVEGQREGSPGRFYGLPGSALTRWLQHR